MVNNNPHNQQVKRTRKRLRPVDIVVLVLLLALIPWAGFAAFDRISYALLDFAAPAYGSLTDTVAADALVLRTESKVTAAFGSSFAPAVADGARVTAGALLGNIVAPDGSTKAVYAPCSGCLVLAQADGAYHVAAVSDPKTDDLDAVFSLLRQQKQQLERGNLVAEQVVVARVVDNLIDFRMLIAVADAAPYADLKTVSFYKDGSNLTVSGRLQDVIKGTAGDYLQIKISSKETTLLSDSYLDIQLVKSSFSGYIVPKSALVGDDEGNYSVYLRAAARVEAKEVQLLGVVGDQAAVTGLDGHELVIANPQKAHIGQKVY